MQTLGLSDERVTPDYACCGCGRDLRKYLDRGRTHSLRILGPKWFVCSCGERYRTGFREWDGLDRFEKRGLLLTSVGLGAVSVSMVGVWAELFLFAMRNHGVLLIGLTGALGSAAILFFVLAISALNQTKEIVASIYRITVARFTA